MIDIPETPYRPSRRLLTGHFHETAGYRAVRRRGVADWLLVATTGGRGRFGHAGGDLLVAPGDWVLLRPGTPHDYGVEPELERWDLLWAHFQPREDWLAFLDWPAVAGGLMRLRVEGEDLATRFSAVHAVAVGTEPRREALAYNGFEALLLALDAHNARPAEAGDPRLARAVAFIGDHLGEKLLVADVAAAAGLSPSRLAHLFRQARGETVQAHIELRRMQLAADLLRRTSFPVKQIADAAGFESQFYFSQRFRRWAGVPPAQFRRQGGAATRDRPGATVAARSD